MLVLLYGDLGWTEMNSLNPDLLLGELGCLCLRVSTKVKHLAKLCVWFPSFSLQKLRRLRCSSCLSYVNITFFTCLCFQGLLWYFFHLFVLPIGVSLCYTDVIAIIIFKLKSLSFSNHSVYMDIYSFNNREYCFHLATTTHAALEFCLNNVNQIEIAFMTGILWWVETWDTHYGKRKVE